MGGQSSSGTHHHGPASATDSQVRIAQVTNTPQVSGLVTIFNREKILAETVVSFLNSGFTDFELILVDDRSRDGSWQVALDLQRQDLGDYANRNRAASYATGTYLKYLDADDLIYPHSLQLMVDAMRRFPEAALALSANVIDPEVPYPELVQSAEFFQRHFFERSPIGVGPSAAIIRRDCFEAVGGFSGRQFVGDTELWLKLAERWPIVLLPPALVWWRRHEGQQMALEMKRPEVLNVRFRLELETLQNTTHLTDSQKSMAERRLRSNHARRLLSFAVRQKSLAGLRLLREAGLSLSDILRGLRGYG
jgi:glycosyltransferase involved in cell wall biosynthesis